MRSTDPHKGGGEPGVPVGPLAPPPVLVGGVQDADDVPGFEGQLLLLHGHMVPQSLGVHGAAGDYPLRGARTPHTHTHTRADKTDTQLHTGLNLVSNMQKPCLDRLLLPTGPSVLRKQCAQREKKEKNTFSHGLPRGNDVERDREKKFLSGRKFCISVLRASRHSPR